PIAEDAVEADPNNYWNMELYRANVFFNFSALGYSFAGIMHTVNLRNQFLTQHPELLKEPPQISEVNIFKNGNSHFVKARVDNASSVELMVCTNSFNSKFKSAEMNDNGINGDELAADGIFTAPITPNINAEFKFYIRSSNNDAIQLSPERAEYEFYTFTPTTSIGFQEREHNLWIYPNPTRDNIHVNGDFNKPINFSIISSVGETVKVGFVSSTKNTIDLTSLRPGMYFLMIENKAFKVIKN
ncbi:MAG: T9SS type A sorting domain-containing protein, partial [Draconibacterium sp.]|nr:T9SS type A sorting domain-containing protein [Draconibacterium sp.]